MITAFVEFTLLQPALLAALLVGLVAPVIGTFIVQRRLSLLGDGIGHLALTGVALGFLTRTSPMLTAAVVAAAGAVAIELIRERGRAAGDLALALLFYSGIAGGVLLIGLVPGTTDADLHAYLFGAVSSVNATDLAVVAGLAVAVVVVVVLFGRDLFVLCQDVEVARVSGLRVRFLSFLLAITAAVTVVVAMRIVGLLLVSALMVVPVAAAQQLTRSFRATMALAMAIGVASCIGGLGGASAAGVAPGAVIVLLAVAAFIVAMVAGRAVRTARAARHTRAVAGETAPEPENASAS